ncbi:sensor histidine kinase [Microvirga alba]|uniref:histidine kinase n=1 Tax=Microvirga alba TaxID=2791025 RepID=A0A931FTD1_9HYPH|nr:ATP-binding protein [Microvirga alba]MBF9234576.1 GHKL domain-containing protein [Microvirga alba]
MNRRILGLVGLWLALVFTIATLVALTSYARLRDAFDTDASALYRVISQRVDQHDAHLTSIAAVLSNADPSFSTLRAVAEAVLRFYPRIAAIDVLSLDPTPAITFTTRELNPGVDAGVLAAQARALSPGQAVVVSGDHRNAAYELVKRLPPGLASVGAVAMTIDARRLVEPEGGLSPSTFLILLDPSGRVVLQTDEPPHSSGIVPAFVFEKALGSRSQPLVLRLQQQPAMEDLLPPAALAILAIAAGLGVVLLAFVLRERRVAKEASARERLREHEARLAHAMRVNTVGEMASGIAHELTQPLTAILSQSQAGLRLAHASEEPAQIIGVLEANVRHAKRAGDILARLRAYVSNKGPAVEATDLNLLVRNVAALSRHDLESRGITLRLEIGPNSPLSAIDRVSIEQVVLNLIRNAADAVEPVPEERRIITLATAWEGTDAVIVVSDAGPGIPAANLPRLFEPFFTTKADGMGLGLSLCERLVEAFGGRITAENGAIQGAAFTIYLPALSGTLGAAAE